MSAFCVETNDKTHVFAADKQVTNEWVEKMCEIAFQVRHHVLRGSVFNKISFTWPGLLEGSDSFIILYFYFILSVYIAHFNKSGFISLMASVPGIGSRSTATLSSIRRLRKVEG